MTVRKKFFQVAAICLTLGWFVCLIGCAADSNKVETASARIKVRQLENIRLDDQSPLDDADAKRIRTLVRNLAKIEKPDFGLSSTLSGSAFAPIPALRQADAFLFTEHGIAGSSDFAELVKLGPKALPILLESLDDPTPTRLSIKHDAMMGAMWFANELRSNPVNAMETRILGTNTAKADFLDGERISSYTVTVGDVCFVIIGQIVNRSYQAVRYQPTLCIVVNSPTHDAKLAGQVRDVWSSTNAMQHLLDSLLLDYASEGTGLQSGAAMRLLYYFPKQTAEIVAKRLNNLDVRSTRPAALKFTDEEEMRIYRAREATNGIPTLDFIKAVAWSEEPIVKDKLREVFDRTDDAEILRYSLAAMESTKPDHYRKRLEEFVNSLPETERGPFGDGYYLLLELGLRFGTNAKPAFFTYMQNPSLQRLRSMSYVLRKTHGEWSVELLSSHLDDKRPAEGWTYAENPKQSESRLPIRVCDEAAETIAGNFPKLLFKMAGKHKDLDVQIKTMRDQITRNDY